MPTVEMPSSRLRAALHAVVGSEGLVDGTAAEAYLRERRGRFEGRAAAIVRPADTAQVSEVVRICAAHAHPLVPQGGNTGLVAGSTPDASGRQVVLSLSRLRRIRAVDPLNFTMTVEAGCVLAEVQAAATAAARLFPLSLAAEGSCQIGGNLSTNAGGVQVLRYGNARELVLGLEVVLADGRVWDGLRALRKDNTGYDLKQLFLGSEGTLGIITAAVLKLFPEPRELATAFVAVRDPAAATGLLAELQAASGGAVTSFEYMNGNTVAAAVLHVPGNRNPLASAHPHTLLVELSGGLAGAGLRGTLEEVLEQAFESGAVQDAAFAQSAAQREALWRIRESIPDAQGLAGAGIKHDVAVSVASVPALLERGAALLHELVPSGVIMAFGHLGDGNVHFNLNQPPGMAREAFVAHTPAVNRAMHDLVVSMGGSFSAEHGIGTLKRADLGRYKDPVEVALMRKLKAAFDPAGQLNPGKLLPD